MLQELSATVFLPDNQEEEEEEEAGRCSNDTAGEDVGICMEQLPLRAQRDIWSALASGACPNEAAAVQLARAFLRVRARPRRRGSDTVCVSLARIVLSRSAGKGEHEHALGSTTAFRRRMRRLTWTRVQLPSLVDETEDVQCAGRQERLSSHAAVQTVSRLSKRHNDKVGDDATWPRKMEQHVRKNTPVPTLSTTKVQDRPVLTKEVSCCKDIPDRAPLIRPLTLVLCLDGRSCIGALQANGSLVTIGCNRCR